MMHYSRTKVHWVRIDVYIYIYIAIEKYLGEHNILFLSSCVNRHVYIIDNDKEKSCMTT